MAEQAVAAGGRGASKQLTDLMVSLNLTRDFLTLVELLDTLSNMQRTPYEITRSLYQAVSKGRDIESLGREMEGFFGPPKKPAGKPVPVTLRFNPSIKYLNGLREEQALYLRKTQNGFFYGALWPWHKKAGHITVHLGYCANKMSDKDFEDLEKMAKNRVLNEKVFDELSSGKGGMVQGISLASFLHMALLEKITCTLEIRTLGAIGRLHLTDGLLIAAETGSLKGKAAAYEIISWDETDIELKESGEKRKVEIDQMLTDVLTEALRLRKDKAGKSAVAAAATVSPINVSPLDRYKVLREGQQSPRNRLVPIVGVAVLVALVLTAGGMFGMRYLKSRLVARDYQAVLDQVAAIDDAEDKKVLLQYFIDSHENSGFSAAAQSQLREIEAQVETEEYAEVLHEVEQLPLDRNYEAAATSIYSQFLEKYPNTPRQGEIQIKISEIPGLIDDVDFEKVKEAVKLDYANRIEAYLDYLVKHPNGRHRGKVEGYLADMSEEYYAHLIREIPRCDENGDWSRCIALCENFSRYFSRNYRVAEVENLKAVMVDKKAVADLMERVRQLGNKHEAAREILVAYLDKNPDTTQVVKIKEKISRLETIIRENRDWETVVAYSQSSQHSLVDRISAINRYLSQNPSGRFQDNARILLVQLQDENRAVYQARIEEQRRKQQLEQERVRRRLEAESQRIAAQVHQAGARYRLNGNGTFTDTRTGLTWALLDSYAHLGGCSDFSGAQRYVRSLTLGGHKDWRLPFANELSQLYKTEPFYPGESAPWYWTSEVYAKGYSKMALIVTSERDARFGRLQKDLYDCGAVRAVRP
jgi:hypothetical protein